MSIRRQSPTAISLRDAGGLDPIGRARGDLDREPVGDGLSETNLVRASVLETKLRRLQRRHARQRCVMAISGHELRQPLQVITAVLHRLMRDTPLGADYIRLEIALEETARLARGLDQLNDAANTTAGAAPRLTVFPISRVLEEVAEKWRFPAAAKGLTFKVLGCAQIVESDATLLLAAVDILVGNAVSYASEGRILLGCRRDGQALRVEVWDTGPCLAAVEIDAKLGVYGEGLAARPRLGGGLAIAREAAKLMGYPLRVRAELGRGRRSSLGAIPCWRTPIDSVHVAVRPQARPKTDGPQL